MHAYHAISSFFIYTEILPVKKQLQVFPAAVYSMSALTALTIRLSGSLKCPPGFISKITSAPALSISAAALVFEAGEFSRFPDAGAFAAWTGLTPSEHSSGESERRGGVTKAGNGHLRRALVEAAWRYLAASPRPKGLSRGQEPDPCARRHAAKGVRRLVERRASMLDRGVNKNKANVATARELACWAWAVGRMAEEAERHESGSLT